MTEAEWLTNACVSRENLIWLLACKAGSPRKLRLLACAFMRQEWEWLVDHRLKAAVMTTERVADVGGHPGEIEAALAAAQAATDDASVKPADNHGCDHATLRRRSTGGFAVYRTVMMVRYEPEVMSVRMSNLLCDAVIAQSELVTHIRAYYLQTISPQMPYDALLTVEVCAHADLIRDLFGNPFRPAAFDPAWRTPDALGLAAAIYARRDFAALPVLADALEEAGCGAGDLLDHLRGPGPHALGCWALDAVLGKT